MSASTRSAKDKQMAAYMKERGIRRTTGKCAICNAIVSLKQMYVHIATHK